MSCFGAQVHLALTDNSGEMRASWTTEGVGCVARAENSVRKTTCLGAPCTCGQPHCFTPSNILYSRPSLSKNVKWPCRARGGAAALLSGTGSGQLVLLPTVAPTSCLLSLPINISSVCWQVPGKTALRTRRALAAERGRECWRSWPGCGLLVGCGHVLGAHTAVLRPPAPMGPPDSLKWPACRVHTAHVQLVQENRRGQFFLVPQQWPQQCPCRATRAGRRGPLSGCLARGRSLTTCAACLRPGTRSSRPTCTAPL